MEDQLLTLYATLSKEAARMEAYAVRAAKDQRPDLERLFKGFALSHTAQARRILLQVRGFIADSETNLSQVINEELPVFLQAYEAIDQQARQQANKAVATGADHGARIALFNRSLATRHRQVQPETSLYVCTFCGFIAQQQAPVTCPICTAAAHRFTRVAP